MIARSPDASRGSSNRNHRRTSAQVLLDAALTVAAREGLGGVSLGAVAREADASKTSVVYRFGSSEGLRRAMAARARERVEELIFSAATKGSGDLYVRGAALLEALFSRENRAFFLALREVMAAGSRDPVVAAETRAHFERVAWIVAVLLGPPLDAAVATACGIAAAVHGHIDLWLCSGASDPAPFRRRAARTALALAAAASRPASPEAGDAPARLVPVRPAKSL